MVSILSYSRRSCEGETETSSKKQNPKKSGSLFITIVLRRLSAIDKTSKSKKIYRLLTTCYYRPHIVGEKGNLNEPEWQELNKQNCWQWAKNAMLYSGLISALAISLTGTGRQQRQLRIWLGSRINNSLTAVNVAWPQDKQ